MFREDPENIKGTDLVLTLEKLWKAHKRLVPY